MILDRLEHAWMYRPLSVEIARALDYLQQTNLAELADGRYELDGDRLFAIVQRYRPKPLTEAMWEAHRRYIDVQYVVTGCERMGCTFLRDDLPVRQPYDAQKDIIFFDTQGDFVTVPAGSFTIFAPHDIHAPSLVANAGDPQAQVCKVVMKCSVPS
jgi:YhcH/YjgK/YiaL family protein